jgi:hypothetical protein
MDRRYPGRPPIDPELEELIVKTARENSGWGYDRIVGALSNLGYTVGRAITMRFTNTYCLRSVMNGSPISPRN